MSDCPFPIRIPHSFGEDLDESRFRALLVKITRRNDEETSPIANGGKNKKPYVFSMPFFEDGNDACAFLFVPLVPFKATSKERGIGQELSHAFHETKQKINPDGRWYWKHEGSKDTFHEIRGHDGPNEIYLVRPNPITRTESHRTILSSPSLKHARRTRYKKKDDKRVDPIQGIDYVRIFCPRTVSNASIGPRGGSEARGILSYGTRRMASFTREIPCWIPRSREAIEAKENPPRA